MEGKLFGLGLGRVLALWAFFVVLNVVAKTLVTKYEVPGGIGDIIKAA